MMVSGHLLIGNSVLGKLHLYIPIQRHLKTFFLVIYSLITSHMQQKNQAVFANFRKNCLIFILFR